MTSTQAAELLRAVTLMRKYQREYFEANKKHMHVTASDALRMAKGFESRVDALLKEIQGINTNQTEMFAR
jgi:hypothetical protein